MKPSSGGLNVVVVNSDLTQNVTLTTQRPQSASVNIDGTFSPSAADILSTSGSQLNGYVHPLSAIMIQIA